MRTKSVRIFMSETKTIHITTDYITLGQFLKFAGIVDEGWEAKPFLATHDIYVDGERECRRGKKLRPGTKVVVDGSGYLIS